MVCLGRVVLKEGKDYSKSFKSKPVSELSDESIIDYLTHPDTKIPMHFALPISFRESKRDIISGRTPNIVYDGVLGTNRYYMLERSFEEGERCDINTYFVRMVDEAEKRGLIDPNFDREHKYIGSYALQNLNEVRWGRFHKRYLRSQEHKAIVSFIRRIEDAHKTASKSKLIFGSQAA